MAKNILHVSNLYFNLSYFIGDQFLHFNKKGYKLFVICSKSEYLSEYSKKMRFEYKEIPILRRISVIQDIISIIGICKFISKRKIDIVVGHTPKGALLSMIASYIMRVKKRIYFRHGLVYETSSGIKRFIFINVERITSFLATDIVCVSKSVNDVSIEHKLNKPQKQVVLGKGSCTGIDSEFKFNPKLIEKDKQKKLRECLGVEKNDFVIAYCGRLVKDKGIIELVNAFVEIRKKDKHMKLLLVGMFEDRDALPDTIKSEILNNTSIIYTGFINDDIQYYYSLMDLFVFPSYREGFGMVVLEASSMKIPVLVSKSTGCIDSIIEGKTGEYIEIDSEKIVDSLEKMTTEGNYKKYGNNGRKFVVDFFDQKLVWKEIEKLYI